MLTIDFNKETIKEIFGWTGFGFSLIFFSAPILQIIKLIKNQILLSTIPAPLFVFSILNCLLWTCYGILTSQTSLYICNSIGASLTGIWIIIYLFFCFKKKYLLFAICIFIFSDFVFQIVFFSFYIGNMSPDHATAMSYVAMVINVAMYAAPGEKIITVIKTNNYKLLPIASSITAFFNSLSWFMFGLLGGETGIIVPNILGMVLAIMQLCVFWYSYVQFKKEGIIETEEKKNLDVENVNKPIIEEQEA